MSGIPNARLVGMERTVNIRLRDCNGNGGLPGQLHALNTAVGTSTKLYGDMRKLYFQIEERQVHLYEE